MLIIRLKTKKTKQHVKANQQLSSCGPLWYLEYSAEVFDVISYCVLISHSYTDDTQAYIKVPATDALVAMPRLTVSIECIEQWMGRN